MIAIITGIVAVGFAIAFCVQRRQSRRLDVWRDYWKERCEKTSYFIELIEIDLGHLDDDMKETGATLKEVVTAIEGLQALINKPEQEQS